MKNSLNEIENIKEFYEKDNVEMLRHFFYTKETLNEIRKYNKKHLFNRYNKSDIKDLEEYMKLVVDIFNENNKYIYNNSNDKKLTR